MPRKRTSSCGVTSEPAPASDAPWRRSASASRHARASRADRCSGATAANRSSSKRTEARPASVTKRRRERERAKAMSPLPRRGRARPKRGERAFSRGAEERVLAREVVVRGHRVDPEPAGERPHGGRSKPCLRKQLERRVDDLIPCQLRLGLRKGSRYVAIARGLNSQMHFSRRSPLHVVDEAPKAPCGSVPLGCCASNVSVYRPSDAFL